MILNWFSPLPPARTEIANNTMCVAEALRDQIELSLWTDQSSWHTGPGFNVSPFDIERPDWRAIQSADISVYQMGNNPSFHPVIWQVSQRHPGIVVLHDECLQHLFAGYFLQVRKQPELYLAHMNRYYGQRGLEAAGAFLNGNCSTEEMARTFPMTQLAYNNALAVVVHTPALYESLRVQAGCPVAYLNLPYSASPPEELARWDTVKRRHRKKYRAIVFGYLAPNRRISAILRAFAEFPNRSLFELHVYGASGPVLQSFQDEIRALGLPEGCVYLNGYVEDLDQELAAADIAFNLRNPSMGECSASQLRIWDHCLPSLVTYTGWYSTLPDDAVAFVRPDYEIEDIKRHLQAFLDNPAAFESIGRKGRERLIREHSPAEYASGILALAENAINFRPCVAGMHMADTVADVIARTLPVEAQGIIAETVTAELARLFYHGSQ